MARRVMRQVNHQNLSSGNLAYDYRRLEAEERRRREREEREYAERRAREDLRRRAAHQKAEALPRRRERIRVSPLAVLGFAAIVVMAYMLLMSHAQLNSISKQVVEQQKLLAALEEEHVKLVSRYETTFDLAAIKEAAESAGMAKPSTSQIYNIDLSAPDNVVLYQRGERNPLGRALASAGQSLAFIVEYFK